MPGIMQMIFKPHDGSRKKVHEEAVSAREGVERAANRLEQTIRELLDTNDKLTGRANVVHPTRK